MTLGERILQLRKASGMSQEQLGDYLKVSRQAISKWELNDSVPDIDKLMQLSKAFSISLDELLKDDLQDLKKNPEAKKETSIIPGGKDFKMNRANKLIPAGIWITAIGLFMLAIESVIMPVTKITQTDATHFTQVPLIPLIFLITGLIIIFGASMAVYGCIQKRRRN